MPLIEESKVIGKRYTNIFKGEPGGLTSMGSHRVGQDWSDLAAAGAAYLKDVTIYPLKTKSCD